MESQVDGQVISLERRYGIKLAAGGVMSGGRNRLLHAAAPAGATIVVRRCGGAVGWWSPRCWC